jgi:hypothetical protein
MTPIIVPMPRVRKTGTHKIQSPFDAARFKFVSSEIGSRAVTSDTGLVAAFLFESSAVAGSIARRL